MALSIRVFIFLIGSFLFIMIFELVRRRKFREELSVIWLVIGIGLILSSFADLIIDPLAHRMGISYPPVLVFVIISFFVCDVLNLFRYVFISLKLGEIIISLFCIPFHIICPCLAKRNHIICHSV